ncbi:hypothetical protein EJ07DRAFT_184209 [Lizonia empirigonia]|nr:hypothetical protein EJ07DRAFT_184209 [Lizonia empirigonia]
MPIKITQRVVLVPIKRKNGDPPAIDTLQPATCLLASKKRKDPTSSSTASLTQVPKRQKPLITSGKYNHSPVRVSSTQQAIIQAPVAPLVNFNEHVLVAFIKQHAKAECESRVATLESYIATLEARIESFESARETDHKAVAKLRDEFNDSTAKSAKEAQENLQFRDTYARELRALGADIKQQKPNDEVLSVCVDKQFIQLHERIDELKQQSELKACKFEKVEMNVTKIQTDVDALQGSLEIQAKQIDNARTQCELAVAAKAKATALASADNLAELERRMKRDFGNMVDMRCASKRDTAALVTDTEALSKRLQTIEETSLPAETLNNGIQVCHTSIGGLKDEVKSPGFLVTHLMKENGEIRGQLMDMREAAAGMEQEVNEIGGNVGILTALQEGTDERLEHTGSQVKAQGLTTEASFCVLLRNIWDLGARLAEFHQRAAEFAKPSSARQAPPARLRPAVAREKFQKLREFAQKQAAAPSQQVWMPGRHHTLQHAIPPLNLQLGHN